METEHKVPIKVEVSSGPVHELTAQIIIILLFQDQSVFGEFSEDINQCLNGTVSRLMEEGTINRTYGETVLIASDGRIRAPKILLLGLGESSLLTYEKLKELSSTMPQIMAKLQMSSFATLLPSIDASKYDYSLVVKSFLEGIISSLPSIAHIPGPTLTIVVERTREEETIIELNRLRSKFGKRMTFTETESQAEYKLASTN